MQLYEKHRPRTLSSVIGQSATVQSLQSILRRPDFTGGAFYFQGASGTGKTTLAKALVNELQIDASDLIEIGGADCDVDFVRETVVNFGLSTWGASGWKAVIIDEAHAMTARAVQAWLPFLEALPARRLIVFTSTEALDADMFGNFSAPMASRCKVFALDCDAEAFALHVASVATAENLNGQPIEAYRSLMADCGNNLRMAFQRIESGEMLRPFKPAAEIAATMHKSAMTAARAEIAAENARDVPSKQPAAPVSGASGDVQARIAAEIAFGAKFLPGSPKFKAHKARLAALESERAK